MTFINYQPFTQHDRSWGALAMATGSGFFTAAASSRDKFETPANVRGSWILMAFALVPFFGGMLWLILDYQYARQPWGRLLSWGASSSGGANGLSIFFLGTHTMIPVAFAMWAWTVAVSVIVLTDSYKEACSCHAQEATREESIPEYAIGTPRDPSWPGHWRHTQQTGPAQRMDTVA